MSYSDFLSRKMQLGGDHGFTPVWMPEFLYGFQRDLVSWATRKGRSAIFADCGLGKTPMQLVWAENVVRLTGKPVLILTPLAVSNQTKREADKFGIEAEVSKDGKGRAPILITNYERLHHFDSSDFAGVVCDESSILKGFDGATRKAITEFMRLLPYRLLCTATAAPNDYIELGTSSEALGELKYLDMIARFFKSNDGTYTSGGTDRTRWTGFGGKYRFRGHAERDFWRWVCSWAWSIRKPSDMGYDDELFSLPALTTREHVVKARARNENWLFEMPAVGLTAQRNERKRTINERCEMAASLVADTGKPAVCWCYLNAEGDLLAKLIPEAVQVAGRDTDEHKVESFDAFQRGQIRVIITKPTIAGFGLNWQHCAHQTFFPSHSFEQWYQATRRSWRFGQTNPVKIDVITSEGEHDVLRNLQRKQQATDELFTRLVEMMGNSLKIKSEPYTGKQEEMPKWL